MTQIRGSNPYAFQKPVTQTKQTGPLKQPAAAKKAEKKPQSDESKRLSGRSKDSMNVKTKNAAQGRSDVHKIDLKQPLAQEMLKQMVGDLNQENKEVELDDLERFIEELEIPEEAVEEAEQEVELDELEPEVDIEQAEAEVEAEEPDEADMVEEAEADFEAEELDETDDEVKEKDEDEDGEQGEKGDGSGGKESEREAAFQDEGEDEVKTDSETAPKVEHEAH